MMLQVSTYRDGRSDLRSAALTLDFAVEDGAWRIARFVTENIFSRDVFKIILNSIYIEKNYIKAIVN